MSEKFESEVSLQEHEQREIEKRIEVSKVLRERLLTDISVLLYQHGRTAWDIGGDQSVLKKAQELTKDMEGDEYKRLLTDISVLLYQHGRTAWDIGGDQSVLEKAQELIQKDRKE